MARQLLGHGADAAARVLCEGADAAVDGRLRALLAIAEKVRVDGRTVTEEDIAAAREAGADDRAIHDTVLVAAAFSMFNRYVDGLATVAPPHPAGYRAIGVGLARNGYLR